MTTLLLGRSSTCRLPRFSALCIVLSASFITLIRTMVAADRPPCSPWPCAGKQASGAAQHASQQGDTSGSPQLSPGQAAFQGCRLLYSGQAGSKNTPGVRCRQRPASETAAKPMGQSACLADTTVWVLDPQAGNRQAVTALGATYASHFSQHDPPHFCVGSTVRSTNYKVPLPALQSPAPRRLGVLSAGAVKKTWCAEQWGCVCTTRCPASCVRSCSKTPGELSSGVVCACRWLLRSSCLRTYLACPWSGPRGSRSVRPLDGRRASCCLMYRQAALTAPYAHAGSP